MKLNSFGTYMLKYEDSDLKNNQEKTSKKDMTGKPGAGRSFRSENFLGSSILLLRLQHHPVGQVCCLQLPALLRLGHCGRGHHLEGGN